ncbi:aldo/keto reductase [Microbacterium sp.]|uniref:aldo/keto reductase n=1 Tax=Microbacterium sp. TaxID=51671 RepID=UPI003C75EA52
MSVPTLGNITPTLASTSVSDESFLLGGDLLIRRIGLGTMRLTDATGDGTHAGARIWRAPDDRSAAVALLRHAVDAGMQLIDTADAYALGQGEELIAEALHPYADGVVIATKVGNLRPSPTEWVPLGNPAYLKQQVELSLRRLRVETIDLLQLHRLDPAYPIADQVGALAELREQGKIRHIGLSEVTVAELEEARRVAPIAAVQNLYNLTVRDHDVVIDHTAAEGIAFIPFFPLAIGEHTRPSGVVQHVADQLGVLPGQVALAWLLYRARNILPIPGTASTVHLDQNVAAGNLRLTAEQYEMIASSSGLDAN